MQIRVEPTVPLSTDEVHDSPAFQHWASRVRHAWSDDITVTVTYANVWRDGQIHSLHVLIDVVGDPWPTSAILRSPTVDVLTTITNGRRWWRKKSYCVFIEQYRPGVGTRVVSNVAGGCSWTEDPLVAVNREGWEEMGMTQAAFAALNSRVERLTPRAVLATPGITNEQVHMFRRTITAKGSQFAALVAELQGKEAGVLEEGEHLRVRLVPESEARAFIESQDEPDAKTLLSLALAGL